MSVVAISMPFISEHCHSHCTKLPGSRKAVIRITGQNLPLNATLQIFCLICASLGCVLHLWAAPEGKGHVTLDKTQKTSVINDNRGRCLLTVHQHLTSCCCPFSTSYTVPTTQKHLQTVGVSDKHNIKIISHGCVSLLSHIPKYTESVTGY